MADYEHKDYYHNPHSLRDQFRNKKTFCRLCGELECQSCEPVSFVELMFILIVILAASGAIISGLMWHNSYKELQAEKAKVHSIYKDKHGNTIETQKGVHLGRGILSNWEIQK